MLETWNIKGHVVEYDDATHSYFCDGVELPSITTMMKLKFDYKYEDVDPEILKNASERGTFIHNCIEKYCKTGEETNIIELKGFKFLQNKNNFDVLENEIPIILFDDKDIPIACGRLDLVLLEGENTGLGDIKTTYELDINYLTYQLNLYRLGYQQSYGEEIKFLKGIYLRKKIAKYVDIEINEDKAKELIEMYDNYEFGKDNKFYDMQD